MGSNLRMTMSQECKHAQHRKCESDQCWCICHPENKLTPKDCPECEGTGADIDPGDQIQTGAHSSSWEGGSVSKCRRCDGTGKIAQPSSPAQLTPKETPECGNDSPAGSDTDTMPKLSTSTSSPAAAKSGAVSAAMNGSTESLTSPSSLEALLSDSAFFLCEDVAAEVRAAIPRATPIGDQIIVRMRDALRASLDREREMRDRLDTFRTQQLVDLERAEQAERERDALQNEIEQLPSSLRGSLDLWRSNPAEWQAEWSRSHQFKVDLLRERDALAAELQRLKEGK